MPETLIDIKELAERLRMSVRTLERRIEEGELDKIKRSPVATKRLFVESSVDAFIRGDL